MRPLLVSIAAFLAFTATADARVFVSVQTAKSVTSGKVNTEHLALSADGVPNTGTVDAACDRRSRTVVVCWYTIEKQPDSGPESVCKRKVTVTRRDIRHRAAGKVKRYPCEPAPDYSA